MKKSKQRDIILSHLKEVKTHPSADELYLEVKKELPKVSLATVYRNLEQLEQHGLINLLPGKVKRYDGNIEVHQHLSCPKCGKICDTEISGLEDGVIALDKLAKDNNVLYRVDFFKDCKNCK